MSAKERITELKEQFDRDSKSIGTPAELEELRVKYLGRKCELTSILRGLKDLPVEERKEVGKYANQVRGQIEAWVKDKKSDLDGSNSDSLKKTEAVFDYTLPGKRRKLGRRHPVNIAIEEMCRIFYGMGFEIAVGPDVETDYYNFEALNIPKDHPARDMQDTFYLSDETVMRTHTSPVQIHAMESRKPPVRIIAPGKCYRNEAISARSNILFHQIEGLYVDEGVTFADLKGTLEGFVREFFGSDIKTRLRANYFPFTEPSAELDITCFLCNARGCPVCKHTGWLEVLGCGMVDPAVFAFVGYDAEKFSGFAWGMGIERIAMLKHGIDDIRRFFENDLRVLEQLL